MMCEKLGYECRIAFDCDHREKDCILSIFALCCEIFILHLKKR